MGLFFTRLLRHLTAALLCWSLVSCTKAAAFDAPAAKAPAKVAATAAVSDVVTAPRPAEGEYFGLYLMGKKVGWLYSVAKLGPTPEQFTAVNDYRLKVLMGSRSSERTLKETKVFEAKPNGKLRSFRLEQSGDGGDQILEGTATPKGLSVVRKRPGQPDDRFEIKASLETVEDADQARVALARKQKVVGTITDTTDLKQYQVTTTVEPEETRMIRGVKVKLRKAVTISEKEKVPTQAWFDEQGRVVEVRYGSTMTANAEAEEVAKRFDVVEVFGLTRVVLPKPVAPAARQVPGSLTLVMTGLPDKFRVNTYRQVYRRIDGDTVEVTVSSRVPQKRAVRPLSDPNGGINLESNITVETNNADMKATAKKIVGDEKDAWAAAKKINRWVYQNVKSDYGASSDRSTDVLKTMKGDCTEHSLLAVTLLRAAGIPAKRVDGVVYVMNEDNVPALYWHEWVEAYVGEWTQLDPTFGQDVADSTHFAVGEEANAEIAPLIGSLKVSDLR